MISPKQSLGKAADDYAKGFPQDIKEHITNSFKAGAFWELDQWLNRRIKETKS